jgi:hypothetical protein
MTDGSKNTIPSMDTKENTEEKSSDAQVEETQENAKSNESEQDQEDSSSQKKETEIDYEAELEIERKRGIPDPIKAKEAFQKRKEKRQAEEEQIEEEESDDDKPLTRKDFLTIRQQVTKELYADRVQDIAKQLSSSDSEARLIVEIHKNRTFPEGMTLTDQMEEAYVIANRKKILSKNSELMRALQSKDTVSKNTSSGVRDNISSTAPKMSAQDMASYTRAGYAYDTKLKVFKKKLPKGFLYKDPRTKKTWQGA